MLHRVSTQIRDGLKEPPRCASARTLVSWLHPSRRWAMASAAACRDLWWPCRTGPGWRRCWSTRPRWTTSSPRPDCPLAPSTATSRVYSYFKFLSVW